MKRIYTWAGAPARRNLTVADLRAGKGRRRFTQVTANTPEEAEEAGAAGIDLLICDSRNVESVRAGNDERFLTAALPPPAFPTRGDVIREAFRALGAGADAVMTARSMKIVSMLAREDVPVMGHLGLVPHKSTWVGGLRAVGRTAEEAFQLFERFRRLEEAGACMVQAEVIPAPVMAAISERSGLVTVSLGSGPGADVTYLFMEDICGESENPPRHARAFFGDLARWMRCSRVLSGPFGKKISVERMLRFDTKPHEILAWMNDALPEAERPSHSDLVELQRWFREDLVGLGLLQEQYRVYEDFIYVDEDFISDLITWLDSQKTPRERVSALKAFRADAMSGAFPAKEQSVDIDPRELEGFLERLEARGRNS